MGFNWNKRCVSNLTFNYVQGDVQSTRMASVLSFQFLLLQLLSVLIHVHPEKAVPQLGKFARAWT